MEHKACAFTGHRPEKFSFGHNEEHPDCERIKQSLFCEILRLTREGVSVFWTGMARGVDIWAAETVLQLRPTLPSRKIKLYAAIPYDRQPSAWPSKEQQRYQDILSQADRIEYVNHEYRRGCLFERDRYMIDKATHLIAVFNGSKGGTQYTINYAQRKGLDITIIEA